MSIANYTIQEWLFNEAHGQFDWREIPKDIKEKSVLLMESLGINFGSLDFIVTTDDEYVFFEVNEQGQFLWIESINPSIRVFQKFLRYMLDDKTVDSKISDFF